MIIGGPPMTLKCLFGTKPKVVLIWFNPTPGDIAQS
jgi:hypothetical protein